MKVSTFIERPVLSAVISITIMVAGIIGLFTLPVEQYPDIAPPTVMVSTTYFGANAETMQKSVVAAIQSGVYDTLLSSVHTGNFYRSGLRLSVYYLKDKYPVLDLERGGLGNYYAVIVCNRNDHIPGASAIQ